MMTQLMIVLSMGLGSPCNAGAGAPASAVPAAPAPPSAGAIDPAYARTAAAARAVFEAEIARVDPSPGVWSGRIATFQAVTYRVTKVVVDRDGRLSAGAEITVHHPLVAGSATADSTPQLRPALARVGNAVIVLAGSRDDRWTAVNEHHGLVIADAAHRAALPRP